jgi:arsenate reductase
MERFRGVRLKSPYSGAWLMRSILFVCTGNTCRSVMAQALAKERFGGSVLVSSAGIRPQKGEDAQSAINALKLEFNIDASGHVPRDVRSLDLAAFDQIIAMDKHVAMEMKVLTNREVIVWKIDDPWGSTEYRKCALKILKQLNHLQLE